MNKKNIIIQVVISLVLSTIALWASLITFLNFNGWVLKRTILLIVLLFVFFFALIFLFLTKVIIKYWSQHIFRVFFLISIGLGFLSGAGYTFQKFKLNKDNALLLPFHALNIEILPSQEDCTLKILNFFTEMVGSMNLNQFQTKGEWYSHEGMELYSVGTSGASLSWKGIAGSQIMVRLMIVNPGCQLLIRFDNETVGFTSSTKSTYVFTKEFPVSIGNRISSIVIIGLASSIFLATPVWLIVLIGAFQLIKISKKGIKERTVLVLGIIVFGFLCIFLVNNLYSLLSPGPTRIFRFPNLLPYMTPAGADFRNGIYSPAMNYLVNPLNIPYPSAYPPLVTLLAVPLTIFPEYQSYLLWIAILFFSNVICILISTFLAYKYLMPVSQFNQTKQIALLLVVGIMVAFFSLTSYPFLFSIERGNSDILAILLSILAVWLLIKYPKRIWLQVILLSIAIQAKLYPLVIFAILFYKHKFKIVFPAIITNLVFLFVLGPKAALGFLNILSRFSVDGSPWIGNHSGTSFIASLTSQSSAQSVGGKILTFLPLAIWIAGVVILYIRRYNEKNALWLLMSSIPLMDIFPSVSHDYKIVIETVTLVLFLIYIAQKIIYEGNKWYDYLQMMIVLSLAFFLGRSYALFPSWAVFFANKYPFLLMLEILILVNILKSSTARINTPLNIKS
jgi:hypothetical protein